MADIESSVALDISDALGAIDTLTAAIRSDVGGAFDDAVSGLGSSLEAQFTEAAGALAAALSEVALSDVGAQLAEQITTGVSEGFAQGSLIGSAALLDTGQQALDALAASATETLPDALAQAGIIGGAAILDTGQQAIEALSQDARDELGGALAAAAADFTSALSGAGSPLENLDLTSATDQFDQLTAAAAGAGEQADETTDDFGAVAQSGDALGTALQVAQGHTGGLTGKVTELAGSAGPLVVGLTAAAGAAVAFAAAGQRSVAATERVKLVFGDFAESLDHIDVGGLNGDLDELAVKAGSTVAPLKQTLANLGQFVVAGGGSQKEAAALANNFSALTLKAIALNPALGDAGQAGQRLLTALQSGRERALVPFGLGIDKLGIQAQAVKLGLIQTIDQGLTPLQRVMAGVSLATEKAGNTLGSEFDKGAAQAATRAKALKAALEESVEKLGEAFVEPLLQFSEKLVPIAEQVGKIAAIILTSFLPVLEDLTPLLTAVADVLQIVADVLEVISPALAPVIAGFLAFKAASALADVGATVFASSIGRVTGAVQGLRGVELTGEGLTRFGDLTARAGQAAAGAAVGLGIGVSSMSEFGESAEGTIGTIGGFAIAGASVGSIIPGVGTAVGALTGAVAGLTVGLIAGGEGLEEYRQHFVDLGSTLDQESQTIAVRAFIDALGDTDKARLGIEKLLPAADQMARIEFGDAAPKLKVDARSIADELEALARSSPAAAEKVVAGFKKMRDETGKSLFDPKQAEILDKAVRAGTTALKASGDEKAKATARNQELTSSSSGAAAAIIRQTAAEEANQKALQAMVDTAVAGLPTVTDAFGNAASQADAFSASVQTIATTAVGDLLKAADAFAVSATPADLNAALRTRLDTVARFQFDLLTILQSGATQAAQLLAAQGPEAGGGLAKGIADAIRNGQPEVATAIEGTLSEIGGIDDRLAGALTLDNFQQKLFEEALSISAFGTNLKTIAEAGFADLIPTLTQLGPEAGGEAVAQLAAGIEAGQPEIAAKLSGLLALDQATKDKFQADIGALAPGAKAAAEGVVAEARAGLEPIGGLIGEVTPEATVDAARLGTSVRTGFHDTVREMPNEFGATLKNVVDKFAEKVPDARARGTDLGEGAKTGVHERARQIPPEMAATIQNVLEAMSGKRQAAFDQGFLIGEGLGGGITAGLNSVPIGAAAVAHTQVAIDDLRSALGIFSPSRVFADQVGKPIAQGIALGIAEGAPDISDALGVAIGPDQTAVQGRIADVTGQARIGRAATVADFPIPVADRATPGPVFNVDTIVLEQASENPVKESMKAAAQLHQGAVASGLL